jgi:hypothetical protein
VRAVGTVWCVLPSLALTALWALTPEPLSAQEVELARVDQLLSEGRFEESRTALEGWLGRAWDGAPRGDREHGLWLRALLTIDPAIAELDYRRLVVEYPGGRYSDRALLRLAQGAGALGDRATSVRYLEMLLRDYPGSSRQAEATALLAAITIGPQPIPPVRPGDGVMEPSPQAGNLPPPASSSPDLPVTVQLGAFSSEAAARALASDPRMAGLEIRLVQISGSPLYRVRIGAFATPEGASELLRDLQGRGLPPIVSFDRDFETPLR